MRPISPHLHQEVFVLAITRAPFEQHATRSRPFDAALLIGGGLDAPRRSIICLLFVRGRTTSLANDRPVRIVLRRRSLRPSRNAHVLSVVNCPCPMQALLIRQREKVDDSARESAKERKSRCRGAEMATLGCSLALRLLARLCSSAARVM